MTQRVAKPDELELILSWATDEGWNPGLEDAAAFHAADPGGFFVATRDDQPVAAISVVNHSDSYAFLGLYLCQPNWRGQGIGYALWQYALAHAGDRTVGLDGVAAQQANYAKSGFTHAGATHRFEGKLRPKAVKDIRPVTPDDKARLDALDHAANGVERLRFLTAWTKDSATRRTLVLERAGEVVGLVTIRRCQSGAKIGPIIAPDAETGLHLARAALAALPAEHVIIDVPEANRAFTALMQAEGMVETFATARMYRGPAPETGPGLQAIATMELG
ncbi:MAG: GNAT family N-acetyltransferase [Maritimibacter sp.]